MAQSKARAAEYAREYRARNREKLNAYRREWYAANRDTVRQQDRAFRAAYRAENRDHINARQRAWYAANKHKRSAETKVKEAAVRRRREYGTDGLTELAAQGGTCAVCAVPFADIPSADKHLDHCHSTGKVRGWLCSACNKGLGLFRDNPQTLRAAADYIEKGKQ